MPTTCRRLRRRLRSPKQAKSTSSSATRITARPRPPSASTRSTAAESRDALGERTHERLLHDIELLDERGPPVRRASRARRRAVAGVLRQRADQLRRRAVPRDFLELAPAPTPRESSIGTIDPRQRRVHRLRLQDPGEHGPATSRPDRVRAHRVGLLRGQHAGDPRSQRQDDPPGVAADVHGARAQRRRRSVARRRHRRARSRQPAHRRRAVDHRRRSSSRASRALRPSTSRA